MHSIKPVSDGSSPNSSPTRQPMQTSPKLDLKTWLTMVQYHANNGASEDIRSLIQLAHNIPEYDVETPPEVQMVIDKIKKFAESRRWDPELSPNSSQALNALTAQLSPPPQERTVHPKCRRELFGNDFHEKEM